MKVTPLATNLDTNRTHYLDSMRGILMLLGVFLHAANVYAISSNWVIHDKNGSSFYNHLSEAIHFFRMPTFFMISGYFTLMMLKKYRTQQFLTLRLRRITLPLISTAIIFNTVELYIMHRASADVRLGPVDFMLTELPAIWQRGEWVSHLWFLNVLVIYFFLCIAIDRLAYHLNRFSSLHKVIGFIRKDGRYFLLAPMIPIFCAGLGKFFPKIVHETYLYGFICMPDILEYLPYFVFGMWLFSSPKMLEEFTMVRFWHIVAFILGLVAYYFSTDSVGINPQRIVALYSTSLLAWLSSLFCFWFFRKFLNQQSKVFRYLSEASYSIYLFHHVCVVTLGYYLTRFDFPVIIKFSLVVFITFGATIALHQFVVNQNKTFRMMFNGK